MTTPSTYHRFEAGKACYELAASIYEETRSWPREEQYGLTSQVRRAAFSAAANIAEGAGRHGGRELRRFLEISLGSLSELELALNLARDVQVMPPENWERLRPLVERAGRMTGALARSIRKSTGAQT